MNSTDERNHDTLVVCFFEDIAQEKFISAFLQRVARQAGIPIQIEIRNAQHGSRVWNELLDYLRDLQRGDARTPDTRDLGPET